MKERPILFSAPMVRALLNCTKSQTRRVVKPQPHDPSGGIYAAPSMIHGTGSYTQDHLLADGFDGGTCPYGQPRDRLWVREAWARDDEDGAVLYRADVGQGGDADDWERGRVEGAPGYRWRPSIHMPRAASRILLEIVSIRVDRLQEISRGDAMAEGCPFPNMAAGPDPTQWYADLWQQINGPGSWSANPYVWVVEFKLVAP